jgi:hypothetical protein
MSSGETVEVRKALPEDLPALVALENSVWDEAQRCAPASFRERQRHFAEGLLVAVFEKRVVGSFYCIRRRHLPGEAMNWLRDSGLGTGWTHDPSGNSLFSISVTVARDFRRGIYRRLMTEWKELAKREGVDFIYAGSRIPGLREYVGTPEAYVSAVRNGERTDPVLSKAIGVGFSAGRLLPGYFHDPDSLDYGVEIYSRVGGR